MAGDPSGDEGPGADDSKYAAFLAYLGGDDGAVTAQAGEGAVGGGPPPPPPPSASDAKEGTSVNKVVQTQHRVGELTQGSEEATTPRVSSSHPHFLTMVFRLPFSPASRLRPPPASVGGEVDRTGRTTTTSLTLTDSEAGTAAPPRRRRSTAASTDPETSVCRTSDQAATAVEDPQAARRKGETEEGKKEKKSLLENLRRLGSRWKKRPMTEARLRKKLEKRADRGDWDAVRKLIRRHDFSSVPEKKGGRSKQRGSFEKRGGVGERVSFSSRGRGSFGSAASAAAAAAIRAAALEEEEGGDFFEGRPHLLGLGQGQADAGPSSLEHKRGSNTGTNILHDVCRYHPPLDVLETLLAALRHRKGCTTATDERGRTPLHLAAVSGAAPALVDALVRADPCPATMGDDDRRSPLHLVMERLVPGHGQPGWFPGRDAPITTEDLEQTLRTVRTLKDAMLSYPGRIDFKDEDATGHSPLDYALEAYIEHKELIQVLIRRREPNCQRGSSRGSSFGRRSDPTCERSACSGTSSVCEEDLQDMEVIQRLERDEIEFSRDRIGRMMEERRREEREAARDDALNDAFGIDTTPVSSAAAALSPVAGDERLTRAGRPGPPPAPSPPAIPEEGEGDNEEEEEVDADADAYYRHLSDYLDDCAAGELGVLEYDAAAGDGFDILVDPEDGFDILVDPEEEDAPGPLPVAEVAVAPREEDGASLVSEVTIPLVAATARQRRASFGERRS